MIRIRLVILLFFICFYGNSTFSQSIKGYSKEEISGYKEKVEDQVRFFEYLLNTVGNSETPARDKDVVIRESYLKIFRDECDINEHNCHVLHGVCLNTIGSYDCECDVGFQGTGLQGTRVS